MSLHVSKLASDNTAFAADPWPEDSAPDLGAALAGMRPLLAGIAGPRIALEIETLPIPGRTRLSKEDLTRVMVNLVRNASEAMPEGEKSRATSRHGCRAAVADETRAG